MSRAVDSSPYVDFNRGDWRQLRASMPQLLTAVELNKLAGIGENIDLAEVADIYLPVARLIHLRVAAAQRLGAATATFLGESMRVPYIIGIAGSVAVGKSTTARVLQALLQRGKTHPRVDLVTTDGFLYPTAVLRERGLLERKGFPESYDRREFMRFITDVKSGASEVAAPVYSHKFYDIIPGEKQVVDRPDIVILEGLNVLQTGPTLMVSDLIDFSIYVDAKTEHIEKWYIDRFLELRETAFREPGAHFARFAQLSDAQAAREAREIWQSINLPNLVENILPTRVRASLVLRKGADHSVERVRMRKL
ncbi:type I pantothenate kinase [Corynebacterium liangguodongii]|uniref:Pantothenate kinase n=1 Tax=Corynebacterium liangguodongii TaxID=2079535 RepID=A0A2S0WD85_9CORY|nr:type I pantothenate kinase [Corynebacterium liangguodongii]AWB83733.1 type I pantothenate kinase [Corynebacterium liangguodongii]PWB99457.1 type I pantothenate kinase [Corynebacterium liangguodongii]